MGVRINSPIADSGADGYGNIPVANAAKKNQNGDIKPDDISDGKQGGTKVGAAICD